MRTAIYVYSKHVTFKTDAAITPHPTMATQVTKVDNSQVTLSTGVYKIVSDAKVGPSLAVVVGQEGADYDLIVRTDDKDPWPDPPHRFALAFPTMTIKDLRDFLPAALGSEIK